MNFSYYFDSKNLNKVLFLILIQTIIFSSNSFSQDYFAMLPNIPTSYISKIKVSNTGDVYATVWGGGVYKSNNKEKPWIPINTGLINFYLTDIEFINSNEILVSTMGGGVFKTSSITNINWGESNTGLTNLNVKCLKTYPNGWILAGTYGSGVFISKDKGANWKQTSNGLNYMDITSIEIADNGWIIAATNGGGIYQSRDTSKTWTRQNSGLKNLFINDVKLSNTGQLYAATNGRGVYMSPNDGIVWSELDTFMTRPYKINPVPLPDLNATCITFNKNNTPVFGTRYGGIYAEDKEEDMTWIPTNIRGTGVNSMTGNKLKMYAVFPNHIPSISDNVGEVWDTINQSPILNFASSPKVLSIKEKELYLYSFTSIKKSVDDGYTWTTLASTPAIINNLSMDSLGNFYASTEKGLYRADPMITNWDLIRFKDTIVYDCQIAPNGNRFVVARYFKHQEPPATPIDIRQVWYSTDGNTWQKANIALDEKARIPKIIPIDYAGNVYVSGGKFIFYSKNNGASWLLTNVFPFDIISIGFMTDNTAIVGTAGNGLYKSTSFTNYVKLDNYPAKNSEIVNVSRNNKIYSSGSNILIDDAYAVYEATYMSIDGGETFTNLNNSFNGDKVLAFSVNNINDLYMSTSSGVVYRAIDSANLSTPKLISIKDKAKDVDINSTFSWNSSKRAELYQLEISYDDEFTYIWESATTSDTTHINSIELAPFHKFYWRVRSKNHSAVSPWSEIRTFVSKLAKPILKAPEDKSINIPVYANLKWEKVEQATKYKVQIALNISFEKPDFEFVVSDTIAKSPLLQGKTKYYWRVMALNDEATSNWSEIWSFTTVFGPPLLKLPDNNSNGISVTPNMVWEFATDVNEYDIQISDKNDFTSIIFEQNSIIANSQISNLLEYDKTYYWRVRSRNAEITSEWSLIWSFRTGYSPVTLTSPADNSVNVAIPVIFKWIQHSTEKSYEIEISKNGDFTNNIEFEKINNTTEFISNNLDAYQEYFWRVRAYSNENTGIWSQTFRFKTKIGVIGLRFPDDKSENHPISIGFIWNKTEGATSYHLQIANDMIFNDLIFSQDTISSNLHTFSQLNPGATYYWRVRAVSPEGAGDWSEVWTFKTGNNIPILLAPENGKPNVVNPIKFEWLVVGGATSYELNVSPYQNFSQLVVNQSNITSPVYDVKELEFPKTYYWRVRAKTSEGNSNWSQSWSFSTVDPSSVYEHIDMNQATIYPNPASNEIIVNMNDIISGNYNLKLIDISGKTIYELNANNDKKQISIDCSKFNSGVYFINIKSGNKIYQGEVMILR